MVKSLPKRWPRQSRASSNRPASEKNVEKECAKDPSVLLALLDSLKVGVAQVNEEGKILYINPRLVQMLGFEAEANLSGSHLRHHMSARNWSSLQEALQIAREKPVKGELHIRRPGFEKTLRLWFAPLPGGSGGEVGITAMEVTHLVQTKKALKESEKTLQAVSVRLLQTQDLERRRLARDLHDVSGQELAVTLMALDQVMQSLDGSKADLQARLAEIQQWIRKVERDIRTMSYVLHPPMLDELGLGSALGAYTQGFTKRTGIEVELEVPPSLPRLQLEKELGVFRVIQECLTNVFRHSGSKRAWVRLTLRDGKLEASVRDEGRGLSRPTEGEVPAGVGMQSMAGRMRMMGGELKVHSSAEGTEVIAAIPLETREALAVDVTAGRDLVQGTGDAGQWKTSKRKRVLIVDDHEVARRGLRGLLEEEPDMEVCGEAENGLQAVELAQQLHPDLVIMDLSMPEAGGFSAANRIRNAGIETRILIYTSFSYPELERMVRASGCQGYVLKSNASKELLSGARAVLRGEEYFSETNATAKSARA